MKKKLIIIIGIVVAIILAVYFAGGSDSGEVSDIIVPVKKGDFEVRIITSGELQAKNSVIITGPGGLKRGRGGSEISILNIVEEGTIVKKGDWVASLDPSSLASALENNQIELEEAQSQYEQTKLDTALQLRQLRDDLLNLNYTVEERKNILEQSKYEPPATIKQAEMDLEKAKRSLRQAEDSYKIKLEQNKSKMRNAALRLQKRRSDLKEMEDLMKEFTIIAPQNGMVIYHKGRDGRPLKAGSQISPWDPTIATLPDMSVMLSKTFVNEVDVRRVKEGQSVEIGFDAFPEKKMRGKVISVANVGEQRPNSDAKVFMVDIEMIGMDDILKPSMTTSNAIIVTSMKDVLHIPLECLYNHNDTITYVYKKDGLSAYKQEVIVGETNADEAVILGGLEEGDNIYLSMTGDKGDESAVTLLEEMNGKRQPKQKDIAAPAEDEDMITLPNGKKVSKKQMEDMKKRRGNGEDRNRNRN